MQIASCNILYIYDDNVYLYYKSFLCLILPDYDLLKPKRVGEYVPRHNRKYAYYM